MNIAITPSSLGGRIEAIPSKSVAHRMLICAALADAPTTLYIPRTSEDIKATVQCLQALNTTITLQDGAYHILPGAELPSSPTLDCGESGSTLRFLLPVAAALGNPAHFIGHGRLPQRPLDDLIYVMKSHGIDFQREQLPLTIRGKLRGGDYSIAGNISSQYITGLLLALPLTGEDSTITLTTKLESASYVDITRWAMKAFGVEVQATKNGYELKGDQRYHSPGEAVVEGDWSNAAFFLTAAALGNDITMTGLDPHSPQGDRKLLPLLEKLGADCKAAEDQLTLRGKPLRGCTIDIKDTPDLLPILAVAAAFAEGDTTFINASRLRLKESDRLESTASMIRNLGGAAETTPDTMTVHGTGLTGGVVDSCNDHRIAMAAAIAATRCKDTVVILGADAVNKSYPLFFKDYNRLGGAAYVL